MPSVLQEWVSELPFMQQSVLLTAVRGPDGVAKYHPSKYIIRWYRRSVLISSFAKRAILNPYEQDGGSFYGPSCDDPRWPTSGAADAQARWEPLMDARAAEYVKSLDELPHHFQLHLMHAAPIVGYRHSDDRVRCWWHAFYLRLVHDMHLFPESADQMNARLGDSRDGWLARADTATTD